MSFEIPKESNNFLNNVTEKVISNYHMFKLPNDPKPIELEKLTQSIKEFVDQYTHILFKVIKLKDTELLKEQKESIQEYIRNTCYVDNEQQYNTLKELLEKDQHETIIAFIDHFYNLDIIARSKFVGFIRLHLLQQTITIPLQNIEYIPEDICFFALEQAPEETAQEIMRNIHSLDREAQYNVIKLAFKSAPHQSISNFFENINLLDRDTREKTIKLLFEIVSKKVIFKNSNIFNYIPEHIHHFMLEQAPEETARKVIKNINNFSQSIKKAIIKKSLELAYSETIDGFIENIEYINRETQREIIHNIIESSSDDIFQAKMNNIIYFSEYSITIFIELLIEFYPKEKLDSFISKYVTQHTQTIQDKKSILLLFFEKNMLIKSENMNPILYKEIQSYDKDLFLRKDFEKKGSRTVLLGKSFLNKVILRIISYESFTSWLKAYGSIDEWKNAGFNYIPIEPIVKASQHDNENMRVYTSVLGISVAKYLTLTFTRKYHEYIKSQIEIIIKTLEKLHISHGHIHLCNFCILHERTHKGEIDWERPPRVYCIDFDRASDRTTEIPELIRLSNHSN